MDVSIKVDSENPVADGIELQKFLAEREINGIDEVEMARAPHQAGTQGLGKFLGDLLVKMNVVSETAKALAELIKAISEFAGKFRKTVKLGDIEIPAGKLTPEQIERLVLEYMKTKNAAA